MLGMPLPPVGTSELLRVLSPHIPDQFINERFVRQRREGRRLRFSAAQLWRVHLLALLTRTFSFNALIRCLPEQEQWRRFAHLPNRFAVPDVRMLKDFRRALGAGVFVRSTTICFGNFWSTRPSMKEPWPSWTRRTYRPAPRIKKQTGNWSARRATLGARSRRPGKTRFFVGYKKHTLRLWISGHTPAIMFAPLVSWATPAHVPEGYLLKPSLWYCRERIHWWPQVVVGDMGYIHQETKRWLRTNWEIAVLTRLKADMQLASPYRHDLPMRCAQGQALGWLNYDAQEGQQWFGVLEAQPLCAACWQRSGCPREFAYEVARHETFLGMIPLNTKAGWKLVHSARSWIEAETTRTTASGTCRAARACWRRSPRSPSSCSSHSR